MSTLRIYNVRIQVKEIEKLRVGIIGSSGGSVLREVLSNLNDTYFEFIAVTDRGCGVENVCKEFSVHHLRIVDQDNDSFSKKAFSVFNEAGGVDFVLLYFARIVTRALFSHFPTYNIHPSLLPAYKGFNAIEKAYKDGVKYIGATLHRVNENIDNGPILAQIVAPVSPLYNLAEFRHISFYQKTYLTYLLFDLAKKDQLSDTSSLPISFNNISNPCLENTNYLRALDQIRYSQDMTEG